MGHSPPLPPPDEHATREDWVKHLKSLERRAKIEGIIFLFVYLSAGTFISVLSVLILCGVL